MRASVLLLFAIFSTSLNAYAIKLAAYIPKENPTGTGIIVCPGGSYFWLDQDKEGVKVAQWLNQNGIAAFVLSYRHSGWTSFAYHFRTKEGRFPAGYNDLCQALDSVRLHAREYGIRKDRIGCMGFSAGGHLVMHAAEQLAGKSKCMSFVVALYPVVSMTHPCTHKRSRRGLLGACSPQDLKDSLSLENHIPANCPPVFLMNCDDDPVVHHHNAELLDSALTANGIPHHYEHYRTGGHGFGVTEQATTQEAIQWKTKFLEWLLRTENCEL